MTTSVELLQKRGETIHEMQNMLAAAEAENRDLNADEQAKYDAMNKDIDSLKARADRLDAAANLAKDLDDVRNTVNRPTVEAPASAKNANPLASEVYRASFDRYARVGKNGLDFDVLNALQVGTDSEGGFITPEEFETQIVEFIQDINQMRQYVSVITTASDRNIPVEETLGSATWLAEEAAYSESDAAFGRVTLGAHKLGTIIRVSEELLQDAFFSVEGYLARNFGKRFGLAEEAAFVNGDGVGKPSGIVGGAGVGQTTAAPTAITGDELIDLYHSVPRQYRSGSSVAWLMNDSTVKMVRKLKDADGQYIWQPGLQAGQPDSILARPLVTSSAMPAATTGNRSVVFGDMSGYQVADRRGMTMQRLNELYAANGQVGFRAYKRMDGKMVDASGIKALVQA